MTRSPVGARRSIGSAHVAKASIPARLAAGRFGPTRLALLLAVISLPAVVILARKAEAHTRVDRAALAPR